MRIWIWRLSPNSVHPECQIRGMAPIALILWQFSAACDSATPWIVYFAEKP
jgi:hypothetical protein